MRSKADISQFDIPLVSDAWPVRRQTYGYLSCRKASLLFDQYQIILLAGRATHTRTTFLRLPPDSGAVLKSPRIVNIWNSLPNSVVDTCTVNAFKVRLDKFWQHQLVKFDFTADLTGTGNRSEEVIK